MSAKKANKVKEEDAEDPKGKAANDDKGEEGNAESGDEAAAAKNKKKKIIIAIAVLLLLVGGGVGLYLSGALSKHDKPTETAAAEPPAEEGGHGGGEAAPAAEEGGHGGEEHGEAAKKGGAPAGNPVKSGPGSSVYYDMPDFLVNLNNGNNKTSFLKVSVTLELADADGVKQIETMKPRIIDSFNVYLRGLRPDDLRGSAGIYRLREELLMRINKTVQPAQVNDILFREIIVQ